MLALALPEWLDLAVAAGTLGLAVATWRLATATRDMADGSKEQLAELRRAADASEAAVRQTERQQLSTLAPLLHVERLTANQAMVSDTHTSWGINLVNAGPVPVTITRAWLELAPQPVELAPMPAGPVAVDGRTFVTGDVAPEILVRLDGGEEFNLGLRYAGGPGQEGHTVATLRAKNQGERWIVVSEVDRHV